MRQLSLSFAGQGLSFLAQASQAEARQRLAITALALERYRLRNGAYPKSLDQLVPTYLKSAPTDFMDGQPLRYCTTDDRHFVLYSVGLDCVDNKGQMPPPADRRYPPDFGVPKGTDLVWPRPASSAEVEAQRQAEEQTEHPAMAAMRKVYGMPAPTPEAIAATTAARAEARKAKLPPTKQTDPVEKR